MRRTICWRSLPAAKRVEVATAAQDAAEKNLCPTMRHRFPSLRPNTPLRWNPQASRGRPRIVTSSLLAEMQRGQGERNDLGTLSDEGTKLVPRQSEYAAALESTGISRQSAHRYQQLAAVPSETFEAALVDPVKHPTAAAIVREARDPVPQINPHALRIWGKARDFERQRDSGCDPAEMYAAMTETMQADMRRLAPLLVDYWASFAEAIAA